MINNSSSLLRKILVLGAAFIALSVLALMLYLSDLMFRVNDSIQNSSWFFKFFFFSILGIVALAGLLLVWKVWTIGRRPKKPAKATEAAPAVITVEELQKKVDAAREMGVDVAALQEEIHALEIEPQELDVAFFGKISTGKSSLIKTLLPNVRAETSIIGGSTQVVERYFYENPYGLTLTLLDMPGTEQAGTQAEVDHDFMTAARGVHIVVYVVDQDLTATDKTAIETLNHFGKPLIVALNKINRYTDDERKELRGRITSLLPKGVHFVEVASVYEQNVRRVNADGSAAWEVRTSQGDVSALLAAFTKLMDKREHLTARNKQSLLNLHHEKLNRTVVEVRREKGENLVKLFSRKAMVGGVAAVGPGSDILIQGYLAMDMLKQMTAMYGISAKEIDLQSVVNAASGRLKSNRTIGLMLAGNICKAFPGVGTVVGGVSHAVAYGLIFESLGKATLHALEENDQHGFSAQSVVQGFERELNHDLEKRAKNLLKIALGGQKT